MKFTDVKRVRQVPYTQNGTTRLVPEEYYEQVPKAPRDWAALVLNAVMAATCFVVAGALTWSTVSLGDLLSHVAPAWAAYLVAIVFDGFWVCCMALEWLSRFDRKRARLPRVAGWIALTVSMTAITFHGLTLQIEHGLAIGLAGALVSVFAKCLWVVVMQHNHVELSPAQRHHMMAERAELAVERALMAEMRSAQRIRAQISHEKLALEAPRPTLEVSREDFPTEGVAELSVAPQSPTEPFSADERYYTVAEMAQIVGITKDTMRLWVHRYEMKPAVEMGTGPRGEKFYLGKELQRALARRNGHRG
jgi:hypothetical protein